MKKLFFSIVLASLLASCSKERVTITNPQSPDKLTLCKTPHGVIVPVSEYDQWKDYVPGDPKFATMGPKLNAQGDFCTLPNGNPGTYCWSCTQDCNCLNVYACTYCANC